MSIPPRYLVCLVIAASFVGVGVSVAASKSAVTALKGRIVLQVESHGEAWYVNPDSGKRYYLKDGATAYGVMRGLGLGIKNTDLQKIPVGIESKFQDTDTDGDGLPDKLEGVLKTNPQVADTDGDGFSDKAEVMAGYNPLGSGKLVLDHSLTNRLKGKILLQVESKGEAWYLNPVDGKRYYLKDGAAAYQVMKYLGLGITNKDLQTITQAQVSSPVSEPVWATYDDQYFTFKYPGGTCGTPLADGLSATECDEPWKTEVMDCQNASDRINRVNTGENVGCMLWLGSPFRAGHEEATVFQIYLFSKDSYDTAFAEFAGFTPKDFGLTRNGYTMNTYDTSDIGSSEGARKLYQSYITDGAHYLNVLISFPPDAPSGDLNYLPYFLKSFTFK